MSTTPMGVCRKRLGMLWLIGGGLLYLFIFWQTARGYYGYGELREQFWNWFTPTITPTLMLVLAVFASETVKKSDPNLRVGSNFFFITAGISMCYLLAVLTLIIAHSPPGYPVEELPGTTRMDALADTGFILAPIQGMVTAVMGVFFFQPGQKKNDD